MALSDVFPPAPMVSFDKAATLYVGDLQPEMTEEDLFVFFRQYGPIVSCRVCLDSKSKMPLGYGFVNFSDRENARRAKSDLNLVCYRGFPIRIMWLDRNIHTKKNRANIFVKNIKKCITSRRLLDVFSEIGDVLSAKISCNEKGESLGYGYVNFSNPKIAADLLENDKALEEIQEKIGDVQISKFECKNHRKGVKGKTNLYLKDFSYKVDEKELRLQLEKFGQIQSFFFPRGFEKKPKGYAFCDFSDPKAASEACLNLNKNSPFKLYVDFFQPLRMRKMRFAKQKRANSLRMSELHRKSNLYVRNLFADIEKEDIKDFFSRFGRVLSCAVLKTTEGVSKKTGFVCFSTEEEASIVINALNGRTTKIGAGLFIAPAQNRTERRLSLSLERAKVAALFRPRNFFGGFNDDMSPVCGFHLPLLQGDSYFPREDFSSQREPDYYFPVQKERMENGEAGENGFRPECATTGSDSPAYHWEVTPEFDEDGSFAVQKRLEDKSWRSKTLEQLETNKFVDSKVRDVLGSRNNSDGFSFAIKGNADSESEENSEEESED